ncbi:hypothetical protein CDIMF43_80041 [Carnobacterium divergens]|nr:hypothetical protein CDIV41_10043 [Carnobacterium divergens]SPC41799.1 hypothetical protein CDIMF43_80041 [Carnobacterium divergens]
MGYKKIHNFTTNILKIGFLLRLFMLLYLSELIKIGMLYLTRLFYLRYNIQDCLVMI